LEIKIMRVVLTALLSLYALCFVAPIFADPVTITWQNPTTFTNGSALVPADIANTRVQFSQGTTFGAVAGELTVQGAATSVTHDRAPGTTA
jgi:hypothetical protein